ncbi:TetR/AcrR family transcriptional regulator [[Mycobacterium] wendilense]|uniref:TetR/AcrR family transcriptional regulator n=1 Tax=[Mycobacterium] wendilense TaxID=3064284 RepID=A0ABM9MGY2_9MYCO|nr:TetR/AcrR family transcriptional regulator [Mycolicibacterium sp. MU0050]CAJ1584921.1 TetR/AcrR family transcriptional regulator [Mycolicibacterium sp. MU0050]
MSGKARRRLSPDDRRTELLALGAEAFGQRPYDEVRIDEIAARAGVSRALMYHYFPDKRAFFAEVIRTEAERLFEATSTPARPGQTLFERLRTGVLAYLEYHEQNPHGSWAAHVGLGRTDPVLAGVDSADNERQMQRIMAAVLEVTPDLDSKVERDLQVVVYGWLAFTLEICRQRIIDPTLDADQLADSAAYNLLDALARIPGIPAALREQL